MPVGSGQNDPSDDPAATHVLIGSPTGALPADWWVAEVMEAGGGFRLVRLPPPPATGPRWGIVASDEIRCSGTRAQVEAARAHALAIVARHHAAIESAGQALEAAWRSRNVEIASGGPLGQAKQVVVERAGHTLEAAWKALSDEVRATDFAAFARAEAA